jgi:hypothetical protein
MERCLGSGPILLARVTLNVLRSETEFKATACSVHVPEGGPELLLVRVNSRGHEVF